MIIGLIGYAQSGKDTVAETLVREHGYVRFAFADALKELALDIDPWVEIPYHGFRRLAYVVKDIGWEGAKQHPDVRQFLQHLGDSARERLYDRVWVDVVGDELHKHGVANAVIADVRYLNEAKWIAERGKTVRISRPGVGPVNGHRSESQLDGWPVNWEILNDGTLAELAEEARELPRYLSNVVDFTKVRIGKAIRR